MKAEFYEIWLNKERRIWEVYTDLNDDVRAELKRNGWTFVLKNEELAEEVKRETLGKHPKRQKITSEVKIKHE